MCKNNFTNENEFDLYGPITKDGVHYYGFGCVYEHATGFGPYTPTSDFYLQPPYYYPSDERGMFCGDYTKYLPSYYRPYC